MTMHDHPFHDHPIAQLARERKLNRLDDHLATPSAY